MRSITAHDWSRLALAACVAISAWVGRPGAVAAQEPTDSLRAEVARLAAMVDSLAQEIERLRAEGREAEAEEAEDELARLRAAAAEAAGPEAQAQPEDAAFEGRTRALQALNPEISLNGDVMAHVNPDDPDADNFFWREFELSLQSALDPFSRAALFISRHGEGPEVAPFGGGHGHGDEEGTEGEEEDEHGGGGFDIEEGYVEWVSLPGGFGLKFGKFFQRFGTLNRWHAHALPFQSRSLPHIAFLGEGSLSQTGASVSWLAPFGGGSAGTYEATVEVTRSENETLFGESHGPSFLGHLNGFWQLGNAVDFELGASWIHGEHEEDEETASRDAFNVEGALNWIEPSRSRQSGLMIRAGYMFVDGLHTEEPETFDASAGGFWSMAELRLSQSWLVGARFDWTENPAEPEVTQWLVSPTITWWQSEYVRIRAEYDHLSGFEDEDSTGMFILQVTFGMGPHKHATY